LSKEEAIKIVPFLDFILKANGQDSETNVMEDPSFWSQIFSGNVDINGKKVTVPSLDIATCIS